MNKKKTITATGMTYQQYADHRKELGLVGQTKSAVQHALETGRIFKNEFNKLDPVVCDEYWEIGKNDAMALGGSRNNKNLDLDNDEYAKRKKAADLKKLEAIAQQEEIKRRQMEGELVEVQEVYKEVFELSRSVRDLLLGVPGRVSSRLTTMKDIKEIENYLEKEINSALEGLSRGIKDK